MTGMAAIHSVHYGKRYNNAMWKWPANALRRWRQKVFDSFTKDIDIIGHELTHGVTQFTANLNYEFQSGALNESVSDIFGIMIKQRAMKLDVKKIWLAYRWQCNAWWSICLAFDESARYSIQKSSAVGRRSATATMDGFYLKMQNTEEDDWGGVHFNSGIPNFAFYVMAYNMGGFFMGESGAKSGTRRSPRS